MANTNDTWTMTSIPFDATKGYANEPMLGLPNTGHWTEIGMIMAYWSHYEQSFQAHFQIAHTYFSIPHENVQRLRYLRQTKLLTKLYDSTPLLPIFSSLIKDTLKRAGLLRTIRNGLAHGEYVWTSDGGTPPKTILEIRGSKDRSYKLSVEQLIDHRHEAANLAGRMWEITLVGTHPLPWISQLPFEEISFLQGMHSTTL